MDKQKVVRVLAPAFKPNDTVLANMDSFFASQPQFDFRYNKKIIQKHPLNSAPQEARARHLIEALNDDEIDIIWCLRGGYGSLQLLPYLDKIKKPNKKKLLIGLSDITSLHIYFYQKWAWSSLHASHIDRWVEGRINKAMLKENLTLMLSEKAQNTFNKIKPLNQLAKKTTQLSGIIVGGNLITLTSHMGTPYELNLKNKFLFIEEIGERAYRLDRCLTQLQIAGKFKGCKGIFIGQMTQCLEPGGKDLLPWLWSSWGERLNIPIFKGIETGHDQIQRPLPLGSSAVLKKMGDQFQLTVEYKA